MARSLRYNGTALDTFGVYWDGSRRFTTPKKNARFYSVPARNGDIVAWDNSFSNVEIQVDCFIRENFEQNFSALVKYLYTQKGYNQLIFDTNDGYYRMAQFVNAIVPSTGAYNKYAKFTLVFNCMPQNFAVSNTNYMPDNDGIGYRVYERNDPKVRTVLNLLSPSQIPEDTLFFMAQLGGVGAINYTQVNMSWSGGSCFFCIFDANELDYTEPMSIIKTSLDSITDFSFQETGTYDYTFVLVGYRDSGDVTVRAKLNGNDYNGDINGLGRGKAVMNGSGNVGVNFGDFTARIWKTSNVMGVSCIVFRRYLGQELVAEGVISARIAPDADIAGYSTTFEDYDYGEVTYFDLKINPERMTCYLVKEGLPDKNFGQYLNMYGDFSGIGDKVSVDIVGGSGTGSFHYIDITPSWWKL